VSRKICDPGDKLILQELASRYMEIATSRHQRELREVWRKHNSLEKTETLIVCSWDEGSNLAGELLAGELRCKDPELRGYELFLRKSLMHAPMGDDWLYEPFLTVQCERRRPAAGGLWGQKVSQKRIGQAFLIDPCVFEFSDIDKLQAVPHEIDEQATADRLAYFQEAFGDTVPLTVSRRPLYYGLGASDLSTSLSELLGLENMMILMIEEPELVHALVKWLQKAVLSQFEAAEKNGDWTPHGGWWENEGTPYCTELPDPTPEPIKNSAKNLWGFCASQEFTLISPAMHEEFLLQYQLPILDYFGLVSYGCCENLTHKIQMLRQIPNLRRIGITPTADVARCAEQIGTDYVFAWRPNPAMICTGFDRDEIHKALRDGLHKARGCHVDVMLKDVSTVQGEPGRLQKWIDLAREAAVAEG
jgi:hypothetical protein